MIEVRDLCVGYGGREVLRGVSLRFQAGRVSVLLGPNGCGKSTLLRAILGLQRPSVGQVFIGGLPAEGLTPKQLARQAAYLPQSRNVPNITACRMVLHGRFPYLSYPRRYRREDYEAVERALSAIQSAKAAFLGGMTPDAILTDGEAALTALGEITGRTLRDELVERIFSRFCVGK